MKTSVLCATALTSLAFGWQGLRLAKNFIECNQFARLRNEKKKEKAANIEAMAQYLKDHPLSSEEIERITSMEFSDLIGQLRSKSIDYNAVLLAYQHKAFEVNSRLNCVVEFLFPDFSDINLSGPLAGLPISIKDCFSLQGHDSHIGCARLIHAPHKEDCAIIKLIKNLGGVPFVKTNTSQTMMSYLSSNPIDGVALNPHNPSRSPGGSSAGEGSLIGGRGSIVGLGTDIGGSVRVPAAFCGIAGFKPTVGRLSSIGLTSFANNPLIRGTSGVMGRDVQSCVEIFRLLVDSPLHYQLDPQLRPSPFSEKDFATSKLKIGYFVYDGFFRAVPAAERAVWETKAKLEARGHELVEFHLPASGMDYFRTYVETIAADQGATFKEAVYNDAHDQSMEDGLSKVTWSSFKRFISICLAKFFMRDQDQSNHILFSRGMSSVHQAWKCNLALTALRNNFAQAWQGAGLDAVICPAVGCPAFPARLQPNQSCLGAFSYQMLFNLLNYPASTVPVTQVTDADVANMTDYLDRSSWHRNVKLFQDGSEGLPVSIQCATLPWREELCLRVMQEIEDSQH